MGESATIDLSAVVWEETACPLCGARDEDEALVTHSPCGRAVFRVAACRRCMRRGRKQPCLPPS